ncbi:NRDE family protein [Halieaceae bacterium IMCC14734]|uniref:NRDE family protein n=1 Tax=Candidatus Litorirhabdus singularis TaxID=2518993 RepID=A0ABT3TCQ1_9GAMM|nr:NRDE family protein [Candidatus Litorirhabdus singularis]MCX2980082.1 NRDE family protein [Candidatus Litorirhabdus singularis]
MCLIIFAHQQHHRYPLLVAANRDEHYQRETANAGFWPQHQQLLAGRDLVAGGTWLGITRGGRFAAITNHRNPPTTPDKPRSRGMLTLDFLSGTTRAEDYLQQLAMDAGSYAGFNLILGDGEELYYYSNLEHKVRCLPPGLYSLSNALLDTPWPKQTRGISELQSVLTQDFISHDELSRAVSSAEVEPDDRLPETGVGLELERLLSAQFIVAPDYGTRATSTLSIERSGIIRFREQNYGHGGTRLQQRAFCINPTAGE